MIKAFTQAGGALYVNRHFYASHKNAEECAKTLSSSIKIITGSKDWEKYNEKIIDNKVTVINNMPDLHPYNNGVTIKSSTVVVNMCNKNFVYYWINKKTFPNVKDIFLFSHPCEQTFFKRWYTEKNTPNIYLCNSFGRYKDMWASEMDNVCTINRTIYEEFEIRNCFPENK